MHGHRRAVFAVAGLSLLTPFVVSSVPAQAALAPAVIMSGSVGSLPSNSALVVVQVGLPFGVNNPHHIPAGFNYPGIVQQTIASRSFSIGIPNSPALRRASQIGHGLVEFNILVFSGSRFTSQMVPVTLTPGAAHGNRIALAAARNRAVTLSPFRAFTADPGGMRRAVLALGSHPATPPRCVPVAYGHAKEDLTRIGEVHVARTAGLSMRWNYFSTSDTDLSVGISSGAQGPWKVDGTYTTSNSLGSGGGYTAPKGTVRYSDGNEWYQRYRWGGQFCGGVYTNQVIAAVGDSREGTRSPKRNPYGSCRPGRDPHGYAVISPHHGTWSQDRGTAWGYSGVATVWNFSFSGHTGFTSNIHHEYDYNNPGGGYSYVCGGGSGMMPDSRILYSGSY